MHEDVRFGRIAGIAVGASWTLLVVLVLITWTLAGGVLPEVAPDSHPAARWAVSAVAAVAFFAGLLAHELAHAVVARSRGMRVEGITLWMFGGVSRLGGEAPDARTELRVAVAGPLTSLALGGALIALVAPLALAGVPDVVVAAVAWLGLMNAVLAVFNLLPAYPLDGGRLLRAAVWARTGDLRRATDVAATVGVAMGYGFVALGVASALSGAGVGGVWLALIGWIVLDAARAERMAVLVHHLLRGVRVGDVMTRDPVTVPEDTTVDSLVHEHVAAHRCSAFPITDPAGAVTGLVSLSRVRHVPADARATTPLLLVATPLDQVVTAQPDEPLVDLLERMSATGGRRALVFDGAGRLVGIVTASDVDRALEVANVGGPQALVSSGRG
ncbi:MAG TPA: site-2 protease family protein [Acidimicrobiales bacterium]|nr:site-2 protease family protein [Acidimicrobiales bacterium]